MANEFPRSLETPRARLPNAELRFLILAAQTSQAAEMRCPRCCPASLTRAQPETVAAPCAASESTPHGRERCAAHGLARSAALRASPTCFSARSVSTDTG